MTVKCVHTMQSAKDGFKCVQIIQLVMENRVYNLTQKNVNTHTDYPNSHGGQMIR